jgi:hypothetical protein
LEARLKALDENDNLIPIPDVNFHILWEGKVFDYDVKIIITRPVHKSSAATDFTVLF